MSFTQKEIQLLNEKYVCPRCGAIDSLFTGPRGGQSRMLICDNCHSEMTDVVIYLVDNGVCDKKRLKEVYSRIPSMTGKKVNYHFYKNVENKIPAIIEKKSLWESIKRFFK